MAELSYRRHPFPVEIIQHAIWRYLRFTLSYRDVEELVAERGLWVWSKAPPTRSHGQQQSCQSHAPLLGGARSHPQSDVDDGWPVQLGGRVLSLSQRQYLAATVPATDATGVD